MTDEQYRKQLFKELIDIVGELGWNIAFLDSKEDEEVSGLLIGEPDYIDSILEIIEDDSDTV